MSMSSPEETLSPGPMTIKQPELEFLLRIGGTDPLITIKPDGTVIVHHEGADKEAAKIFYESLQFEGQSFFECRERVKQLERVLAAAKKIGYAVGSTDSYYVKDELEELEEILKEIGDPIDWEQERVNVKR